jgi:hypothetical protein
MSPQQRLGRGLHGRGTLPDRREHTLDAGAKIGDRRIDGGAALLALTQRVALPLGEPLLRNVGMRRYPAAVGQWPHDQRNRAAVRQLEGLCLGTARGRLFEGVGDILIGVAREFAVPRAANKDLAQRRPLAEILGRQL